MNSLRMHVACRQLQGAFLPTTKQMLVNAHSFSIHKTTASGQLGPIMGRGKTLLLHVDCDLGLV
eukprot:365406-Chlamydomonas_euryale.AAC.6